MRSMRRLMESVAFLDHSLFHAETVVASVDSLLEGGICWP